MIQLFLAGHRGREAVICLTIPDWVAVVMKVTNPGLKFGVLHKEGEHTSLPEIKQITDWNKNWRELVGNKPASYKEIVSIEKLEKIATFRPCKSCMIDFVSEIVFLFRMFSQSAYLSARVPFCLSLRKQNRKTTMNNLK